MNKVLILFAHPDQPMSKVNLRMFEAAKMLDGITAIDLYGLYPRFKVDIEAEQQRLLAHDLIIFQFPIYWYSTPALLKEWQDLVLEHGFAYGKGGSKLAGKSLLIAPERTIGLSVLCSARWNKLPGSVNCGICHRLFFSPR